MMTREADIGKLVHDFRLTTILLRLLADWNGDAGSSRPQNTSTLSNLQRFKALRQPDLCAALPTMGIGAIWAASIGVGRVASLARIRDQRRQRQRR